MALALLVACDSGSRCKDGYYALEPGSFCSGIESVCYRNAEGGFCSLDKSYSVEECQRQGGVAMSDPGDLSLLRDGCPNGGRLLAGITIGVFIEGGLCCAPR